MPSDEILSNLFTSGKIKSADISFLNHLDFYKISYNINTLKLTKDIFYDEYRRHSSNDAGFILPWVCCMAQKALKQINPKMIEDSIIKSSVHSYLAAFMYARDGFPHFNLVPDFFNSLLVTDFGESEDLLRMPFDAFSVSIPKTNLLGHGTTIFIFKTPQGIAIEDEDSHHKVNIYWENAAIFEPLEGSSCNMTWSLDSSRNDLFRGPKGKKCVVEINNLRKLIANLMTYIEASGALPTKKREHGAPAQPVEKIHRERPLFDVGRTVKLTAAMREALQASVKGGKTWELMQRFIVRGHWKNQVYGPGRTLRRRQWIEPFWKGPEDVTKALERTYEVTV